MTPLPLESDLQEEYSETNMNNKIFRPSIIPIVELMLPLWQDLTTNSCSATLALRVAVVVVTSPGAIVFLVLPSFWNNAADPLLAIKEVTGAHIFPTADELRGVVGVGGRGG